MPTLTQAAVLRRAIDAARLLAEELAADERTTKRLLAGLREAGLEVEVQRGADARWRYSLRALPAWLARVIEVGKAKRPSRASGGSDLPPLTSQIA